MVAYGANMQDVQPLYKWIVDSVVAKARSSFLQEGIDECASTTPVHLLARCGLYVCHRALLIAVMMLFHAKSKGF